MTILTWRFAGAPDLRLLGTLNKQLIDDEGHRNPMSVAELSDRMKYLLAEGFRAVLFEREQRLVAYALYSTGHDGIYLRQFFVVREARREGIGRAALALLQAEVWPAGTRLFLDVLVENTRGLAFWRALGFADYAVTMEKKP
jgi:GNAT superfamily N-acetyltransferase